MENALGRKLTDGEFKLLWTEQYDTMSKASDYAHYNITKAAIIATDYPPPLIDTIGWLKRYLANQKSGGNDMMREDMAGWLGDATLGTDNGKASFAQDDYKADLDAENVMFMMRSYNISHREAEERYFCRLANGESRATIFLSHTPIDYVIRTVCKEVGIRNPDEKWHKLSEKAPDAYSFILNLMDGNNEWEDY